MPVNINCKSFHHGKLCRNPSVKRKLFGMGDRVCLLTEGKPCPYQQKYTRPPPPPPPPMPPPPAVCCALCT